MKDSKQRFSNRVENYLKYRPRYPKEIIGILEDAGALHPTCTVADLGSGTGFLAELFLERGCFVYGVEPNEAMRLAGEDHLSTYSRFRSINGSAEDTTLPDESVDLVTVGQALHWFDPQKSRAEMLRISLAPHWLAIAFNDRDKSSSPFMQEYDELLYRCTNEYEKVRNLYPEIGEFEPFFGNAEYHTAQLVYRQEFDVDGLVGRVLSSSYAPAEGEQGHEEMVAELQGLFARHQHSGKVEFVYRSLLVYGRMS